MPAYTHIIVCHSVALLKLHGSIGVHANQGVEAAHKLIRQKLNHTNRAGGKQIKQVSCAILERHYRIEILRLVYEADVQVEMRELEDMSEADAQAGGWQQLGGNFLELMEMVGTKENEAAKALRMVKRSSAVVAEVVNGVAIQPIEAAARKRSRITALPTV